MFEKKRGTRFLASVMAIVMLLSLAPVGALAAETTNTFEATAYTQGIEGSSPNGKTKAYAMWKDTDNNYYLAIASVEGNNKVDEAFQEKFPNAQYIKNDQGLTVKLGDEVKIDNLPPKQAADNSNGGPEGVWIILVMTPTELKGLGYQNGTFNLEIRAGGFNIGTITINDDEFKGTVNGDVEDVDSSTQPSEPSPRYVIRFYVSNTGTKGYYDESNKYGIDGQPNSTIDGAEGGDTVKIMVSPDYAILTQCNDVAKDISTEEFKTVKVTGDTDVRTWLNQYAEKKVPAELTDRNNVSAIVNFVNTQYNGSGKNLPALDASKFNGFRFVDAHYVNSGECSIHVHVQLINQQQYIVEYNPNGGTGAMVDENLYFPGDQATVKTNEFTRTGYTFDRWNTEADGTGMSYNPNGNNNKVTIERANVTLYAQWTANTHTVTYTDGANGTVFSDVAKTGTYGEAIPKYNDENNSPTRDDYTFKGWASSVSGITPASVMPDQDVTFTAIWEKKKTTEPENPTSEINAKYFVLMPSKGKPTSGQNQGPRNYFPNATDNGGVKYSSSLTGYRGKISTSIIQDHPKANTKNGYFVANGIDSKYLVVPSNLGYFSAGYTGKFPSALGDNFTMQGKKIIWYVVKKNAGTDLTPIYHVDGYLAGVPVELRYHENFNFSGTDDVIVTVDKNGDNDLLSGDTVTISGISEAITAKHPDWTFVGWTENRDGSGTSYKANDPKVMMDSCDLYAQWKQTAPSATDTYTLKITYVYENGAQAAEPYTAQLNQNETYKVDSPPISGYVASMATVEGMMSAGSKEVTVTYYLDNWKDADKTDEEKDEDAETGGDGIPDSQQILIEYKAYEEGNGTVDPTFEVITVKEDGKLTQTKGSTANAKTGYVFVTWSDKNAVVNETTVDSIVSSAAATTKTAKWTPTLTASDKGKTYTYTAIFLEDKVGSKNEDGSDKGDGIPDAWQYKVTFQVVNGNWNVSKNNKNIVVYVNAKDKDGNTLDSKLTAGQIPAVGSQPNSGYTSSGSWKPTLSTDLEITKDTVFTYTYDQKSGGSGGSGGSSRPSTPPTVDIPDNDVPTGLNGKDHYAYIIGYGNNDVRPQNNITRAEVATIFFRLLTDETREANMTKSNSYNDVKDGDWFCCAVSTLSKMGIIKGYEDGSFKPNDPISRAEFAAIAARFDPDGDKTPASFADVTSHWAKDEISIAANHGWIKGYEDGSFKPDQKITRAETMTLVNRVLNRLPETKDDLHKDMKTWVDNMDETAWYYLAVQEATNSHYFKNKTSTKFEQWTDLRDTRDWSELEK